MENGQEKVIQLSFFRHVICQDSSVKVIKGHLFLRVPLKWRKKGKKGDPRQFSTSHMPIAIPGSKTKKGLDTCQTFPWLPPFDFKVSCTVLKLGLFLWPLSYKVHCKRNACFLLTTVIAVWGSRRQRLWSETWCIWVSSVRYNKHLWLSVMETPMLEIFRF